MKLHKQVLKGGPPNWIVLHYDHLAERVDIEKVESLYNVTYMGEFTAKAEDGTWFNGPVQLYYQPEIPPTAPADSSNYLVVYVDLREDRLSIANGLPCVMDAATQTPVIYSGVLNEATGEILYSAFRHDFQKYGELIVDGGRDYFKGSLHPQIQFIIKDGELQKFSLN